MVNFFGLDPSAIIGSMGSAYQQLAPAPPPGNTFQPAVAGDPSHPVFLPSQGGGSVFVPAQAQGMQFAPADVSGNPFMPANADLLSFAPSPGQGGYVWGTGFNPLVDPPRNPNSSSNPLTGPGGNASYTGLKPEVAQWAGQVQSTFGKYGSWVSDAMMAIIQHESQGNPNVQNQAGYPAYGLFQLWEQPGLNVEQQFAAAEKLLQSKLQMVNAAYAKLGIVPDDERRARDLFLAWSGQFDPATAGPSAARDIGSNEDGNAYLEGPNGIMPMYRNIVRGKQQAAGGGDLLGRARSLIGTPYSLGGLRNHPNQPQLGLDCSEYTAWVYAGQGIDLPWNAQQQFNQTARIDPSQLRPGDLVFFSGTNPQDPDIVTHVGMYTGDGKFINAQDGGVMEVDLNSPYWSQHYYGAGRVVAGGGQPAPQQSQPRQGYWG